MSGNLLALGMLMGLILSSTIVYADEPADCEPSITLEQTRGIFQIYEGGDQMNPITAKRIDGVYVIVDINGNVRQKDVAKSISKGQLQVIATADLHHQSKSGKMAYYLNGRYYGSIEETY